MDHEIRDREEFLGAERNPIEADFTRYTVGSTQAPDVDQRHGHPTRLKDGGPERRPRRDRLVGDLKAGLAAVTGRRRSQGQSQRASRASLLSDHVAEVVGMNAQLERRVVAGAQDLDLDVLAVVDDAARHVRDQILELTIDVVRFTNGAGHRRRPVDRSPGSPNHGRPSLGNGGFVDWTDEPRLGGRRL